MRGRALSVLLARAIIWAENAMIAVVRRVLFPLDVSDERRDPERILLYRSARLGDFIAAIPAMAAVRRRFPRARIALLTTPSTLASMKTAAAASAAGAGTAPWLGFVYPSLVDEIYELPPGRPSPTSPDLRAFIARFDPDVVFMLSFAQEPVLSKIRKLGFFRLIGIRSPVYGWRQRQTRRVLGRAQHAAGMFDHQVIAPLRAIAEHRALRDAPNARAEFPISRAERAEVWAETWCAEAGRDGDLLIGIFPGGTFDHKRWPVERFAEVARIIRAEVDQVQFVILGGPSDVHVAHALAGAVPGSIDVTGRLALDQTTALLRRCVLVVGNDSGPMHVASAVGCPVVSIMSAIEFSGSWEPWNSRHLAVRQPVACEGCYSFTHCPLGTRACIDEITVERVVQMCRRALGTGARLAITGQARP